MLQEAVLHRWATRTSTGQCTPSRLQGDGTVHPKAKGVGAVPRGHEEDLSPLSRIPRPDPLVPIHYYMIS
jgi:hypothetical protein